MTPILIELVTVPHDRLHLHDRLTGWIAGRGLGSVGYVIVGQLVGVWGAALAYWRLAKVEQRWAPRPADGA